MVAATAAALSVSMLMSIFVVLVIPFALFAATTSAATTAAAASGFFGDWAEEFFYFGVEEVCVAFEVPAVMVGDVSCGDRAKDGVHALAVPLFVGELHQHRDTPRACGVDHGEVAAHRWEQVRAIGTPIEPAVDKRVLVP